MSLNLKYCFILISIFYFTIIVSLEGCSRIFWQNKINYATARTMDLIIEENPTFTIFPRDISRLGSKEENSLKWTSKYGSVVITAFNGESASDGMNEKGLAAHVLYLENTDYTIHTNLPKLSYGKWIQYFLDNCATVKEAVELCNTFQLTSETIHEVEWPLHLCLEDCLGDSAIIEYLDGKILIYHGPQYTILTNDPPYALHLKNLKNYQGFGGLRAIPLSLTAEARFIRCTALLQAQPEPQSLEEAINTLLKMILTVKIPLKANEYTRENPWPTRWISIVDTTNLMYYFLSMKTSNMMWIDMNKVDFTENLPVRSFNPHDPNLKGEIQTALYRRALKFGISTQRWRDVENSIRLLSKFLTAILDDESLR